MDLDIIMEVYLYMYEMLAKEIFLWHSFKTLKHFVIKKKLIN
jgi:hypothetical protein